MARTGSIAARALLAVLLLVLFYVFAIGISVGLFAIGVFTITHASGGGAFKIAGICIVTGCVILWSIAPRPDHFEPPGPRLDAKAHPRLFKLLREIARDLAQPMPDEVYLVPDVNAFVTQRGGAMGIGGRRVVGLGLPLLQALTVSEMRGVVAHEFGHFVGGDTKLGPWLYKTRAALGRTIVNLGDGVMAHVFLAYFKVFLRISEAVSRAQEYEADAVSARLVGARALISGLKKSHTADLAFNAYMNNEYLPVLDAGFRAPLAEGFGRFLGAKRIASALGEVIEDAMSSERPHDPYDSHPPLPERVAALEALPQGAELDDDEPAALTLLEDVARLERELLALVLGEKLKTLERLAWDDAGKKVTLPRWKQIVAENRKLLDGVVAGELGDDPKRFAAIGKALMKQPGAPPKALRSAGVFLVGSAIGLALSRRGFELEDTVGEAPRLVNGKIVFAPFKKLSELAAGELAPEKWKKACAQLGIDELDLGTVGQSKKSEQDR